MCVSRRDKASGEIVAIKKIDIEQTEDDIADIQREISFQSLCDDPNVTKYLGSYLWGKELYILMEFMGAGSLADMLKVSAAAEVFVSPVIFPQKVTTFNEEQIQYIVHEITLGIHCLHKQQKIHRDIKGNEVFPLLFFFFPLHLRLF